jgi:hypothetical protein
MNRTKTRPDEQEKKSTLGPEECSVNCDQSCLEVLTKAVGDTPGILGVELDVEQQQLLFDYDPNVISDPGVDQVVRQVEPMLQHNCGNLHYAPGQTGRSIM